MAGTVADPRLMAARAAPKKQLRFSWSDPRFRAIVWQIVIVGIVVAIAWYLIGNTNRNLAARHIATGFAFLGRVAGIPIGESLISYDPAVDTYGRALIIGILNTLKVAVIGIVLATILGTLIGIGRLSNNWLLAKLTAFYVETLRDIPLLLQLLFWYIAAAEACRRRRQALHIGSVVFLSNRGMQAAGAGLAAGRTPGRCSPSSSASVGDLALEPPRPPAAGGNRRAARGLAGGAACC